METSTVVIALAQRIWPISKQCATRHRCAMCPRRNWASALLSRNGKRCGPPAMPGCRSCNGPPLPMIPEGFARPRDSSRAPDPDGDEIVPQKLWVYQRLRRIAARLRAMAIKKVDAKSVLHMATSPAGAG